MTRRQAHNYRAAIVTQRTAADDQTAVRSSAVYDTWEYLVEIGYTAEKAGYRFRYGEQLYKTRLDAQRFAAVWVPGTSTGALFEALDIEHAGTVDDPIPFTQGMELVAGKYYSEDGVTYLCTRDSGTPIYHSLVSLVELYVEVA